MAKSRGFTVEQKTSMKVAYEEGTILKVLAEKWQVSVPTMSKYIKSVGGTLRNPGTPKKVKDTVSEQVEVVAVNSVPLTGLGPTVVPQPEISTPQAPVARRILPFE